VKLTETSCLYDCVYSNQEDLGPITLDFNFYKSVLKLNSLRINKIKSQLASEFDSSIINYDYVHFIDKNLHFEGSLTNKYKLLSQIKGRYNELYSLYLEKDIKRLKTNIELFNLLFILTRNFVREIDNQFSSKRQFYYGIYAVQDIKSLLPKLYNSSIEEYSLFRKYMQWSNFNKNNLKYCDAFLSKFVKTREVDYLNKSVLLLQSICRFNISFDNHSGYFKKIGTEKGLINYYSRLKFDSYGNYIKSLKLQNSVKENLNYFVEQGYSVSFLTLSCKNLSDFCKEDITGNQGYYKILKELWRTPITKQFFYNKGSLMSEIYRDNKQHLGKTLQDIFPGSFGVLELKEKENLNINAHLHYLLLRDKSKSSGFIDVRLISNMLNYCCDKFGSQKFKGSFHAYIKKVNIYQKDKNLGAAKYILNYLSKGLDAHSLECRELFIDELKGVNLIRSSGLLHQSKIKENHVCNLVLTELNEFDSFCSNHNLTYSTGQLVRGFSVGGRYISNLRKNKSIDLNLVDFSYKKLFGATNFEIMTNLLYDNKKKSSLFYEIKNSIWSSIPIYDEFSHLFFNQKVPCKFGGVKKMLKECWFTNPIFILDAFKSLGYEQDLISLSSSLNLPIDMDKILYDSKLEEDFYHFSKCC
jgi:hypothetical protein